VARLRRLHCIHAEATRLVSRTRENFNIQAHKEIKVYDFAPDMQSPICSPVRRVGRRLEINLPVPTVILA